MAAEPGPVPSPRKNIDPYVDELASELRRRTALVGSWARLVHARPGGLTPMEARRLR